MDINQESFMEKSFFNGERTNNRVPGSKAVLIIGIFITWIFMVNNYPHRKITEDQVINEPFNKDLPAFPGAEGFGSRTPGGRGGRVIEVTNLNASGPGSFLAACEASGPRIVVFRTGGIIKSDRAINIQNPFITIAGQTAPGDGICIQGAGINIATHDVIMRGIRVRVGDDPNGPDPENRDAIAIANRSSPPYNIIIDHCSASWAIDETIQLWYPCRDITVQWCIISESLHKSLHPKGAHGTGIIIGDYAKNISVHHNLLAHNNGRNPLMKQGTESEFINNIVYNWGTWEASMINNYENHNTTSQANIIGNYYKLGPNNSNKKPVTIGTPRNLREGTKIYVKGNIGPGRMNEGMDELALVSGDHKWLVNEPALPLSDVSISNAHTAFEEVLRYAGAIVPKQDAVDNRIKQNVMEGTGRIIDSQNEVGGWPVYRSGKAPVDTDRDGMPDEWEIAHGLDPKNPNDGNLTTLSPEGYTNIEVYINGLFNYLPY
jgi:pectate lyase